MTEQLPPPPPAPIPVAPAKKPIYKRWWLWAIVAFLVVGIAASQGSNQTDQAAASDPAPTTAQPTTTEAPEPTTTEAPKASASANLACRHWRNVIEDGAAGILTPAEAREKIKEVWDDAQVADEEPIRTAARNLLASVTQGEEFSVPGTELLRACADANAG
jgi:hypothetical protein